MNAEKLQQYKEDCKRYLRTLGINDLRNYSREIGVAVPTKKTKEVQIEEIVAILCGELAPILKSNRGAPIKNDTVDPRILEKMSQIKEEYEESEEDEALFIEEPIYNYKQRLKEFREKRLDVWKLEDPEYAARIAYFSDRIYRGQFQIFNEVGHLLPLDSRERPAERIIVPPELVKRRDLREGDIVSCRAGKGEKALVVAQILTVNGMGEKRERVPFDEALACYPSEKISFSKDGKNDSATLKYLDWLLPIAKGQRACVISAPKAGKSTTLYQIATTASDLNNDLHTFVLLLDQSPELIGQFSRTVPMDDLVYTTYEDEADRHVFAAEFILQRAKRYVEYGRHVLLVVDSLSKLAHAYNETEESAGGKTLAGGLERNTLRYIKRYLGSARCIEGGGSLTIVGGVSSSTGDPADELICNELISISNWELRLDESLAAKRVFPALNHLASCASLQNGETDALLREELLKKYGNEWLIRTLSNARSLEEFEKIMKAEK